MTTYTDCRQQIAKGPRCELCHGAYQRSLRSDAVAAGYISEERGFIGLRQGDVALALNGYEDLELLVRLRSAQFDDRRLLTTKQIYTAPTELDELIDTVFLPRRSTHA